MDPTEELNELLREIRDLQKEHLACYKAFTRKVQEDVERDRREADQHRQDVLRTSEQSQRVLSGIGKHAWASTIVFVLCLLGIGVMFVLGMLALSWLNPQLVNR